MHICCTLAIFFMWRDEIVLMLIETVNAGFARLVVKDELI